MSRIGRPPLSEAEKRARLPGRFWSKVARRGPDECWLWTGSKDRRGYGKIGIGRVPRTASRVCWELTRGPIPDGLMICHHCDNPSCVNPAHLFVGTGSDNLKDAVRKKRHPFQPGHPFSVGEANGNAKLNQASAAEIRRRRAAGETCPTIAASYGVSPSLVRQIGAGLVWRDAA